MSKTALIIGRFQPMHLGHLKLIKRYYNAGFSIKVAIGSANRSFQKQNPLTVKEREDLIHNAMKEYGIKSYRVFRVPDIDNDESYVKYVLTIVGRFNIILTGNPKVLRLFRDFKTQKLWDIESFEETTRPGGDITATDIRKRWMKKPSKKGLSKSVYGYLKTINFTERLRKVNSS